MFNRVGDYINDKLKYLAEKYHKIEETAKNGKEKKKYKIENKELKQELSMIKSQLESKESKVKRVRKIENDYNKKIKNLSDKVTEERENKELSEEKKQKMEERNQKLQEENDEILKDLNKKEQEIKEKDNIILEHKNSGDYIPYLQEQNNNLEMDLQKEKEYWGKELAYLKGKNKSLMGQNKELRRNIGGKDRKIRNIQKEFNNLKKKQQGLKLELNKVKREKKSLEENTDNLKRPENVLKHIDKRLNKETINKYKRLENIWNKYLKILEEKEKEEPKYQKVYGNIYEEDGEVYIKDYLTKEFIEIDDVKGKEVKNSHAVCAVKIYEDGTVVFDRFYSSINKEGIPTEQKLINSEKRKTYSSGLNTIYDGELYEMNVIFISGVQIQKYNKFFGDKVEVIEPFSLGEREMQNKINKADIIMVRTDAVPHAVTDYIKENKKEDAIFLYKSNLLETGNRLYNKVNEKRGKN